MKSMTKELNKIANDMYEYHKMKGIPTGEYHRSTHRYSGYADTMVQWLEPLMYRSHF